MQKMSFNGLDRNVLLDDDEQIIYQFKPKKSSYILSKNTMPWFFALIWLLFDSTFMILFTLTSGWKEAWPIFPFMAIHMMPVWIFIVSAIKLAREHKAINYIITNKRVIEADSKTTVKALFSEIDTVEFSESPISKLGTITFKKKDKQTLKFEGINKASQLYATIRLIIDNNQ